MILGEKLRELRIVEGAARGLSRELTQAEVSRGIENELGGRVSQSYLSQIENGTRPHLTATTRMLLARFFHVHPGYLVDDIEGLPLHVGRRLRTTADDRLDAWLIDGAEEWSEDGALRNALLAIAKHPESRKCILLLGSLVENRELIDHLCKAFDVQATPPVKTRRRHGSKRKP
ncbi:MAG TPA: helix-turn-helix transcriptional regulator [Thermoanaerobaculia bacterium]|nr:helix-turn-helix transcriptional regulator [Thermoanaerobaculia bacterium]